MPTPMMLPADRLFQEVEARHGQLRTYFLDKDAEATETADGWSLALEWPNGEDRHVDPRLREGLDWWGEGVTRSTMALQYRRAGGILTALYDTWTLVSWSEWLARQTRPIEQITVLHVDDHRDLGSPRLFIINGALQDPLTGEIMELHDPQSVRNALMSGALGMGSFMTPFLRQFPKTNIRHLCQPPKAAGTAEFEIIASTEPDTLLKPGALRPTVVLEPASSGVGPGRYRMTPDVADWLADLGPGPILLHIDMDYFNNRYDGDSAWADRHPIFDPPLARIFAKIDEMVAALMQRGVGSRIEDVVIAYSPGFFPAEFWRAADARLRSGLEHLHEH